MGRLKTGAPGRVARAPWLEPRRRLSSVLRRVTLWRARPGTPPRLDGTSIDYGNLNPQVTDEVPVRGQSRLAWVGCRVPLRQARALARRFRCASPGSPAHTPPPPAVPFQLREREQARRRPLAPAQPPGSLPLDAHDGGDGGPRRRVAVRRVRGRRRPRRRPALLPVARGQGAGAGPLSTHRPPFSWCGRSLCAPAPLLRPTAGVRCARVASLAGAAVPGEDAHRLARARWPHDRRGLPERRALRPGAAPRKQE